MTRMAWHSLELEVAARDANKPANAREREA